MRFINDVFTIHIKDVFEDIKKNEEKTIKDLQNGLKFECGYKEMKKQNNIWAEDYKKQGYKFMSRENIFKTVSKLLS